MEKKDWDWALGGNNRLWLLGPETFLSLPRNVTVAMLQVSVVTKIRCFLQFCRWCRPGTQFQRERVQYSSCRAVKSARGLESRGRVSDAVSRATISEVGAPGGGELRDIEVHLSRAHVPLPVRHRQLPPQARRSNMAKGQEATRHSEISRHSYLSWYVCTQRGITACTGYNRERLL